LFPVEGKGVIREESHLVNSEHRRGGVFIIIYVGGDKVINTGRKGKRESDDDSS